MAKNLSLLCVIIYLGYGLNAQEFVFNSENPFNIQVVSQDSQRIALKFLFADRDFDGDLDLFEIGFAWDSTGTTTVFHMLYFIDYQENIGTPTDPQFGPRETAFEGFKFPYGPFVPSIADLNNDGLLDIVAGAEVDSLYEFQHLVFYLNTGKPEGTFERVLSDSFDLSMFPPKSLLTPEVTDIDMDGAPDILLSAYINPEPSLDVYTDMVYLARNVGSVQTPEFLGWFAFPYGLAQDSVYEMLKAGDLDGDGDMDLMSIAAGFDTLTPIRFYRNTPGQNGRPRFEAGILSPFGLPEATDEMLFVDLNLTDIDGDQDLDLFLLTISMEGELIMYYYENIDCLASTTVVEEEICDGESVSIGGMDFSATGVYMVTLTGSNGCDSIIELYLTVLPLSETMISEQLCAGDIFMIGSEVFTTSGDYMVVLTDANGCDSLVLVSLQFDSVDISISQEGSLLTATLTGASYQWFDCDSGLDIAGATNRVYEPASTGSYAVHITTASGCTGISTCYTVTISSTSEANILDVFVYPNPASDWIWIRCGSDMEIRRMTIYSGAGTPLRVMKDVCDVQISIRTIPEGVYLLQLDFKDTSRLVKLVLIRS